jgi:outer membrane protein OmpA-like peptidoglycan-associated protein
MFKKISLLTMTFLMASSLQAEGISDLTLKYGLTTLDNDDGWELKNHTFGIDATFDLGYAINPRVDLTYVSVDDEDKWGGVSSLLQGAVNAQYGTDLDILNFKHQLYAFGGIGYEYVVDGYDQFDSLPFFQGGIGAKLGILDNLNIIAEYKALQVFDNNNDKEDEDNEHSILLGINYEFGQTVEKVREVKPTPTPPAPEPTVVTILDSDQDGVPDDTDDCPNTKMTMEMEISERGCPILPVKDSDNDGISDDIDACKNSPKGSKVDDTGCAIAVNLHINFASNSANINAGSMQKIEEFATYLKNSPAGTNAIIEGHTDSSGNEKKNIALSKKRAYAVKNALIQAGASKDILKAVGKGSTTPIATNKTPEGRTQNRRIEAIIKH